MHIKEVRKRKRESHKAPPLFRLEFLEAIVSQDTQQCPTNYCFRYIRSVFQRRLHPSWRENFTASRLSYTLCSYRRTDLQESNLSHRTHLSPLSQIFILP